MWSLGFGAGLIALGVPVAVCIGLAATLALASTGTPLLVIPQQLSPTSTTSACWRSRSSC
jgi:C4-dicarboxylate transporter DctM subunit